MKSSIRLFTGFAFAILIFSACKKNADPVTDSSSAALKEADSLLATAA